MTTRFFLLLGLSLYAAFSVSSRSLSDENGDLPRRGALTPSWHSDLGNVLQTAPLPYVYGSKAEVKSTEPVTSLWFIDNDTVVATFVVHDDQREPRLSKRDAHDINLPLRLRAVFLDTHTGSIKFAPAWPTESRLAVIVAAHDGEFVTRRGTDLSLYKSDGTEQQSLKLPSDAASWGEYPSPTGKNVLFISAADYPSTLRPSLWWYWSKTAPVSWVWVTTDDLSIKAAWKDAKSGSVGISDTAIAMTACVVSGNDCVSHLSVRNIDAEWRTITAPFAAHHNPSPHFVNDDLIFLLDYHANLLRTSGALVFDQDVSDQGCAWGGVYPAANGKRFAVPSCALKGAVTALDLGGYNLLKRIFLYDAPFRGQSYALDIKDAVIKGQAEAALSPDGTLLAVLSGTNIYMFDLPAVWSKNSNGLK